MLRLRVVDESGREKWPCANPLPRRGGRIPAAAGQSPQGQRQLVRRQLRRVRQFAESVRLYSRRLRDSMFRWARYSSRSRRGYEIKPIRRSFMKSRRRRTKSPSLWKSCWIGASAAGYRPIRMCISSARRRLGWKARPRVSTWSTCWRANGARCSAMSATFDGQHHHRRERLRRRWRISGAGGHGEPYAGAGSYLAAGLFRRHDPSSLHGRTLGVGDWAMRWR